MEKLKPCPYCGETPKRPENFFGTDGENLWGVSCENVNCHVDIGVWHEDEDEAIRMWNALPRTLRWKHEPPSEPGWYFCKRICPGAPKLYPLRVVHIHYDEFMGKRVLCYSGCALYGVEDDRQDSYPICDISKRALEEMWWAGPIQEPLDTAPQS